MKEYFKVRTHPVANPANIISGDKYRITVLTDRLVRMEYSADGIFEDRPTQIAFNRDFPATPFTVKRTCDGIEVDTAELHITYNEGPFTAHGLSISLKRGVSHQGSTWHYGEDARGLTGTARTLDQMNGGVDFMSGAPLEMGPAVVGMQGYALLDDSASQVILPDGWVGPRKKGIWDLYFFGYGRDFKAALRDFFHLCGKTPMVPRFALGNWWSRYYEYTEESYLELMNRFDEANLPFTVAVIDMDWHLVNIDPSLGSGWTGYTWNPELFPDPARFLSALHARGMRTTLNLHPADGVRRFEKPYAKMAEAMGIDPASGEAVQCDVASPKYMEAYFDILHHPLEEEGVDFWWIDWQQGTSSRTEGLDPLWILNHFHYLDSGRDGKRPMTFSRYAGPGSHRYPIGFSGDTIVSWASLQLQPWFTANASNIGYGWWSHDIAGHMLGEKNDEMATRWVEFGIYSPIMRLHSSKSNFNAKEPWRYKKESEIAMSDALRQRHRMIPYLYTMNRRAYEEDLPMILPMYYEYPYQFNMWNVNAVRDQYFFGTELLVAPITTPRIPGINVGKKGVWLPDGAWYDIYTGLKYDGGRTLDMYRDINSIPVLAKAGSILPLTDEIRSVEAVQNPKSLRVRVFCGADGAFTLYEDDNETNGYTDDICVRTKLTYTEGDERRFTIGAAMGEASLIPQERAWTVELTGLNADALDRVQVAIDGKAVEAACTFVQKHNAVVVAVPACPVASEIVITVAPGASLADNDVSAHVYDFLNQAEVGFIMKDLIYSALLQRKSDTAFLTELHSMDGVTPDLFGAIAEIVTAQLR